MKLPYLPPATHLNLGTVIQGEQGAYIAPPGGQGGREFTLGLAFYALGIQRAFDDLERVIGEMDDDQRRVATWVRNYVLQGAEQHASAWHGPFQHHAPHE